MIVDKFFVVGKYLKINIIEYYTAKNPLTY